MNDMGIDFNSSHNDDFTIKRDVMVDKFRENHDNKMSEDEIRRRSKSVFKFYIMLSYFFILFGLVFLVFGCYRTFTFFKDKHDCTVLVEGTVDSFNSHRFDSDDDSEVSYAPVFSYVYNDEKHIHIENNYSEDIDLSRGQKVSVYVDPDNPDHVYIPDYKEKYSGMVSFIIIGLALAVCPVVFAVRRAKEDTEYWIKKAEDEK